MSDITIEATFLALTRAAPVDELHRPHAGRMLSRRYVPPSTPGTIRSTVIDPSSSTTPHR